MSERNPDSGQSTSFTRAALDEIRRLLDFLADDDVLELNREVTSRATKIYGPRTRAKFEANHATGMANAKAKRPRARG